MTIPKLIHQTDESESGLDARIVENIARLKALNPAWSYRFYEDRDRRAFIARHYSADFVHAYDRFTPDYGASKADFFRYLLIHEVGGVYLDIKSSCSVPLDTILKDDDEYLLSHWKNDTGHHVAHGVDDEFQQWHVMARPRHPFLRAVIDHVKRNIDRYDARSDGVGKIGVLKLTGPIAYTRSIAPLVGKHPHRMIQAEDCGFVYSILLDQHGISQHRQLSPSHYRKSKVPILRGSEGGARHWLMRLLRGKNVRDDTMSGSA